MPKEDNKYAVRDNTAVAGVSGVGYLPAYEREFIDRRIDITDSPMGYVPVVGDILQGLQVYNDLQNGHTANAALGAGLLLLPPAASKLLQKTKKAWAPIVRKGVDKALDAGSSISPRVRSFLSKYVGGVEDELKKMNIEEIRKSVIDYQKRRDLEKAPLVDGIERYLPDYKNAQSIGVRPATNRENIVNYLGLTDSDAGYMRAGALNNGKEIAVFKAGASPDVIGHEFRHSVQRGFNGLSKPVVSKPLYVGGVEIPRFDFLEVTRKPLDETNKALEGARTLLIERNPGNAWKQKLTELDAEVERARQLFHPNTSWKELWDRQDQRLDKSLDFLQRRFNLENTDEANFLMKSLYDNGYKDGGEIDMQANSFGPGGWIKNLILNKVAKKASEFTGDFLSQEEVKTILQHPKDYAKYLGWDENTINERKKNFYKNFTPWGYDTLAALAAIKGEGTQEYPIGTTLSEKMARDYLLAEYLDIPQEERKEPLAHRMYEDSPYSPSLGGDTGDKYIRFSTDYNRNKIVDLYNNLLSNVAFTPTQHQMKAGKPYLSNVDGTTYHLTPGKSGHNYTVTDAGIYDFNRDPYAAALGQYTIGTGYDANRGQYISVYDRWDLNPFRTSFYSLPKTLLKTMEGLGDASGGFGKPVNFYDRVYLDDYYGIDSRPEPGSYYGGYLIPATVVADKKSSGGKIHIKPENRGKFTALKERTGHSSTWFKEHGTPAQKKMATFALNAKKWKHGEGGPIDYSGITTTKSRPYNTDYIAYIDTALRSGGLNDYQRAAVLANIIEESGGNPFAEGPGGFYGLLQWSGERYPKTEETDVYKEIDNQVANILSTYNNGTDKMSWTHGGKGSGYNSYKDAMDAFAGDSLDDVMKAYTLGYVRPAGGLTSYNNRLKVAQQLMNLKGFKTFDAGGFIDRYGSDKIVATIKKMKQSK